MLVDAKLRVVSKAGAALEDASIGGVDAEDVPGLHGIARVTDSNLQIHTCILIHSEIINHVGSNAVHAYRPRATHAHSVFYYD